MKQIIALAVVQKWGDYMKAVLLSIKPQYCELIASGNKKVEIRKIRPKLNTPFKCYIYQTKHKWVYSIFRSVGFKTLPNTLENALGKIIGEFICDKITTIFYGCEILYGIDYPNRHSKQLEDNSCLTLEELKQYANGKELYAWHISDFRIYDKPKELWEFYRPGFKPMEEFDDEELCGYCYKTNYGKNSFGTYPGGCWSCEGNWCEEAYESYLEDEFLLTRPPQSWCYVERQEKYI